MKSPAALVVIDVQMGMLDPSMGARNNPSAERQIARLLAAWRNADRPVIHVQHMSTNPDSVFRPGQPGNAIQPAAAPAAGEPVFQKSVNSAFIGTGLEGHLRSHGITSLAIVGMTTDHCVSTTVRMAGNLGFDVCLVEDATAAFERIGPDGVRYSADQMHRTALASLHDEFAQVISADEAIERINA